MKRLIFLMTVVIIFRFLWIEETFAQEYEIGPEDVLSITFWQQPQLNTSALVSQSGTIVLPVIGSVTAAGLTPTKLAAKIVDRISVFNRNISQASVVVTEYGSKKVYVTGHVTRPGKYTFEVIPNLWKIISEAGGPSETAMLTQVKIIRGGVSDGKIITVDLTEFLEKGDISKLPPVYTGDMIKIPGISVPNADIGVQAPGGVTETQIEDDVIYIYGQVVRPGGYRFTRNMDLLEAIIIAGGPSSNAKLDEVRVITQGNPYSSVAIVDLEQYSKTGNPAPFLLNPGDTIFIPTHEAKISRFFQTGNLFYDFLRIVVTASTSYLIFNLFQ